jgi:hypothetical protein
MYSLDTIYLFGNPIVNNYPQLAKIENNASGIKKALDGYFGGSGGALSGFGSVNNNLGGGSIGSANISDSNTLSGLGGNFG